MRTDSKSCNGILFAIYSDRTESSFDISQYKDMSLWGFGLLGAILAAIIQSGGAIGVITLTALQQGIITFPASIAIMM